MNNLISNYKIPKLGFGLMRLPVFDKDDSKINIEEFKHMVDYYMENEMNYFDTAYMYHNGFSESATKEALVKRYDRDKYFLANKLPLWLVNEKSDMDKIFNTQLERCGVDYFDFYLIHAMNKDILNKSSEIRAYDYIKNLKSQGKVKHIGFSFHDTPDILEKILSTYPEMEFVQLQINYLDWNGNVRAKECYDIARKYNKPIIIMEPIRGGILSNMSEDIQKVFEEANPDISIASWALRFCASLDGIMTILSGMSNIHQLSDNISIIKNFVPLNDNEYKTIDEVIKLFDELNAVPCTSCKYCIDCPQGINIPANFEILNNFGKNRDVLKTVKEFNEFDKGKRANNCIACGKCENVCPQSINIIERLSDISMRFELN